MTNTNHKNFLRTSDIVAEFGVSRSSIYRWRNNGTIPEPRRISERFVGWPREQIEEIFLK
ncbi:helix-turn-helix transcriptional regulator [Methylomarinum roseum]|uniref:helix-turn-helix transcriptional regulator n=1 Tax=Methylomarinum roseum TaxID=3067653 RepID=UPI003D7D748F